VRDTRKRAYNECHGNYRRDGDRKHAEQNNDYSGFKDGGNDRSKKEEYERRFVTEQRDFAVSRNDRDSEHQVFKKSKDTGRHRDNQD